MKTCDSRPQGSRSSQKRPTVRCKRPCRSQQHGTPHHNDNDAPLAAKFQFPHGRNGGGSWASRIYPWLYNGAQRYGGTRVLATKQKDLLGLMADTRSSFFVAPIFFFLFGPASQTSTSAVRPSSWWQLNSSVKNNNKTASNPSSSFGCLLSPLFCPPLPLLFPSFHQNE